MQEWLPHRLASLRRLHCSYMALSPLRSSEGTSTNLSKDFSMKFYIGFVAVSQLGHQFCRQSIAQRSHTLSKKDYLTQFRKINKVSKLHKAWPHEINIIIKMGIWKIDNPICISRLTETNQSVMITKAFATSGPWSHFLYGSSSSPWKPNTHPLHPPPSCRSAVLGRKCPITI